MINIAEVKRQLRIVSKLFKSLVYNGYSEYVHYNSTRDRNKILRISIQLIDGAIVESYTLYSTKRDHDNSNGYTELDKYSSIDELIELNKKERNNK